MVFFLRDDLDMAQKLRLKDLRENNFWSQEKIANLLKIKRRTYAEYELENNMVPLEILIKLAFIYHVNIDYICFLNNSSTPYGTFKLFNKDTLLRNLKLLRKKNNLTQKELGMIFSYSQNTISEYEKGIRNIPLDFLINLSKYYNLPIDYILGIVSSKISVATK